MPVAEAPQRIEDKTIQPIPLDERHGKPRDLFSLWFGSNIMLLTVVTGALATSVYGLPFWLAVIAIVVGNLVGAVFMALHSAQGPRLGVPQMMQTRGQFGSYGSLIVIVLVVVMYVGFFASNLVLAGQSLNVLTSGISVDAGILIVGAVSVVVTIFGYDLIHAYARVMTYLAGAALLLTFIWIVAVHGLGHGFGSFGHSTVAGFLGTVTAAALWQIAYAPYVSDYSRYMPAATGARPAFWASYWGCSLGSILPMILGAMIGVNTSDMVTGLHTETGAVASLVIIIFTITIAMTNSMNIYGGALSMIAIGQTFKPAWLPGAVARAAATVRHLRRGGGARHRQPEQLPGQLQQLHPAADVRARPVDRDQPGRLLPGQARELRRGAVLPGRRRDLRAVRLGLDRLLPDRHRPRGAVREHHDVRGTDRQGAERRGHLLDHLPDRDRPAVLPGGQAAAARRPGGGPARQGGRLTPGCP